MDRGAWWATVRGVAERWTRLSTHTHTGHSSVQPELRTMELKKQVGSQV